MNDERTGWPFVLTRNPWLDWRAIMSPGFMVEIVADFELLQMASPASVVPHPWPATMRSYSNKACGPLTLVFASSLAQRAPGVDRVDRFGRSIRVVYGVVLRGYHPTALALWAEAVERLEVQALEALEEFWNETDEHWIPRESDPVVIPSPATSTEEAGE